MQFTFLGTSGMVPTKKRNVSGYFLKYGNHGLLIDCGEGTQRQMNLTGIKRTSITKILITHWHGDHMSGLCGLLHTINNETYDKTIELYGPPGTSRRMKALMEAIDLKERDWLKITELKPKKVECFFENEDFQLFCAPLKHSTPCIAYSFHEKERLNLSKSKLEKFGIKSGPHMKQLKAGKDITYKGKKIKSAEIAKLTPGRKITLITDTEVCDACYNIAENSDVLICESTYDHSLVHKAKEYEHMTSVQAAEVASQSNSKKLYLTHFSQRYKDVQPLVDEARVIFDNTFAAEDFLKFTL